MKDYYKVLHVSVKASSEEIEDSYNKLSKEYKPEDHYPEESYHVRYYKEIQEAYKVLSNNVTRAAYTKELQENADQVEDVEKRHREEGFGDVLKLLLNDPKSKPKKQTISRPSKPKPKSTTPTNIQKPLIVTATIIALAVLVFLVVDNWKYFGGAATTAKSEERSQAEKNSISKGENTLLEESIYGTGEENYESAAEESNDTPNELNEEVSDEVASLSLNECLNLISKESTSFEKKEDAIARALQFFVGKNVNVKVIGANNVQTRRETIEDYLFILMLQGYDVQIVNSLKNEKGKISEISIREDL